MTQFQKILVPVDFSEHAARALDHAIALAKQFGSEIELLHSYEVMPIVSFYGVGYPDSLDADLRAAATTRLAEWRERVAREGISVRDRVVSGPPAEEINEWAENLGVDLIVMGTRGLRGLKHVMLGSVAERTLRRAPCPVLTVRDTSAD